MKVTPAERAMADDFLAVFGTDPGKRVLAFLEEASGYTQALLGHPEDLTMFPVREGRRQLYLEIREQLVIATTKTEDVQAEPGLDPFGREKEGR